MRLIIIIAAAAAIAGCSREEPGDQAVDQKPVTATPATGLPTVQASFDCNRADGQSQELVCGDASLAAMDREVARLASVAAEPAGHANYALKRDNCWKADELRQCVMAAAMIEIHRLRQGLDLARNGEGPSAGPVAYDCTGIAGPVRATFVNAQPGAVALEWGGQVIAIDHVGGTPNSKYDGRWDGQRYAFRTNGKEATFTVAGKGDSQCTEAPAG